jgi:hypothetical protein
MKTAQETKEYLQPLNSMLRQVEAKINDRPRPFGVYPCAEVCFNVCGPKTLGFTPYSEDDITVLVDHLTGLGYNAEVIEREDDEGLGNVRIVKVSW